MRVLTFFLTTAACIGHALGNKPAQLFKRAEKIQADALARRTGNHPPPSSGHHHHHHNASRFLTPKTRKFKVNSLPDVNFDIGEIYAGNLPISGAANETRELFFFFAPSTAAQTHEEVTLWLNGGPGCSSLAGLLQENGPFLWQPGTYLPTQNSYSWTNLTNMLWVEQPVGVGFTRGVPDIYDEVELAEQFVGFYQQFVKTFDIQGWDLYLTGESYAGYYVPYIADGFIRTNDSDINLKGISVNDPIIGDETLQQAVVIQPFVEYWSNLFNLNTTTRTALAQLHQDCGYADYLDRYFTFPPPQEKFPVLPDAFYTDDGRCDLFSSVIYAATEVNPCFNYYHISDYCPFLWTVTGSAGAGYQPPGAEVYFNRTDVQRALHAPVGTNWEICSEINVFGGPDNNQTTGDQSLGPAQNDVLRRVVEYTNNVIIGSGNLDILLSTNGTLLALQNMTWNGEQGFQQYPGENFFVPYHPEYNLGSVAGAGIVGSWGRERGLTFYQVQLSGHELPEYAPGAAYRALEYLLGRVDSLSARGDFTTQSGNFTRR